MFRMNKYIEQARELRAKKRLGQNFLTNVDIARAEAEYARGRNAVELGPGLGILTNELCKTAKHIVAVEKDSRIFGILEAELKCKNLKLVNGDFFKQEKGVFEGSEIMVSNIPYNLSSKTISWVQEMRIEALICVQKEFAEHMLAKPDTKKYSKLSVMAHLMFNMYEIMRVPRNNFYPVPKVDSVLVYLKPKNAEISRKAAEIIGLIMEHKKKSLRNALADSSKGLGITSEKVAEIGAELPYQNEKLFKLEPEQILESAETIASLL